jgi:hypothetical protein
LQHNNIYIVALTKRNSNVTSIFVFLERLVEVRSMPDAGGRLTGAFGSSLLFDLP